ncbi:crossover junction endonuclease EME1 [Anopheles nili]|uniref:crossover junction endonuclease EME1 n=1 Tax=Anopheles nili TaxID=185578 RepID=UPI00237BE62A|nr:crossover junction endonuclease EME1 [Anopheles nili]
MFAHTNPERLKLLNHNEEQRNLKPGQCNKFLHVVIDPAFLKEPHGALVLSKLSELGCKYELAAQPCASTITFYRCLPMKLTTGGTVSEKRADEPFAVHLIDGATFVTYVRNHQLLAVIRGIKEQLPKRRLSLLVFGLLAWCRVHRGCVGRRETEHALTEVQLHEDVSYQLLETDEQVANFVCHFARGIAERPYKQQQMEKHSHDQVYFGNEKKGCVRVEGTAGLQQLYQAQLIKIPAVTLEIAEAIMSVHPSMKSLLEAFRNAGPNEAPNVLAGVSIRRAGGPITTSNRRIGPELSRKIYLMYASTNSKQEL